VETLAPFMTAFDHRQRNHWACASTATPALMPTVVPQDTPHIVRSGPFTWRILILLAVVLAFAVSYAMLAEVIGTTSPWLALLLMFYFLAVAKVAEPLFMLTMPGMLYPLRQWETDHDVVRRFAIRGFGRLLRKTPLRYLNAEVYFNRGQRDPAQVRRHVESSEAAHFWAGLLFTPCIAYLALDGRWIIAAVFLIAQMLVNVYPVLHLRYVRGRLDRLRARLVFARSHATSKEPT
jgi:hypothetical protein